MHPDNTKSGDALGAVLKKRRFALGLTQRALAATVGVKASHVAYIEMGRRKPSIGLLSRLADILGLNKREVFLLAYPDAREMVEGGASIPAPKPERGWEHLVKDNSLLKHFGVTPRERRALEQLNLLGYVHTPVEFLAILSLIRSAAARAA